MVPGNSTKNREDAVRLFAGHGREGRFRWRKLINK